MTHQGRAIFFSSRQRASTTTAPQIRRRLGDSRPRRARAGRRRLLHNLAALTSAAKTRGVIQGRRPARARRGREVADPRRDSSGRCRADSRDEEERTFLVSHAKRALRVIRQNVALALATKLAFLIPVVFGAAPLWLAVVADTGATVAVTLNGLRLLRARTPGLTPSRRRTPPTQRTRCPQCSPTPLARQSEPARTQYARWTVANRVVATQQWSRRLATAGR